MQNDKNEKDLEIRIENRGTQYCSHEHYGLTANAGVGRGSTLVGERKEMA